MERRRRFGKDDFSSEFTSSDTILNQIWDLCKYTIKATSFAGLYIDGDRERIPYEADAIINQLSHYCVDGAQYLLEGLYQYGEADYCTKHIQPHHMEAIEQVGAVITATK